jgi:hypothetical protein
MDIIEGGRHFSYDCGSIDEKHIRIISSGNSRLLYFNYKDYILSLCSRWLIITTHSWQLMSVLMAKREILGYLPSHIFWKIFQTLWNSRRQVLFQAHIFTWRGVWDEAFELTATLMRQTVSSLASKSRYRKGLSTTIDIVLLGEPAKMLSYSVPVHDLFYTRTHSSRSWD